MNYAFPLEQITKTGGLNADLLKQQYILDKTAKIKKKVCQSKP